MTPAKFKAGDKVLIVAPGVHHNDLVGTVQIIDRQNISLLSEPGDPIDYFLVGFPRGSVQEDRLALAGGSECSQTPKSGS